MESERTQDRRDRRAFLAGALRVVALGAFAVGGALAVAKRRRLIAEGKCVSDGLCDRCGVLAECGLPAALAAKDSAQRGDNGQAK